MFCRDPSVHLRLFFKYFLERFLEVFTCAALHPPGDLPSLVALALSGSLWPGCSGPAHGHQPESPFAAETAVPLPGQGSWCLCPPHGSLRHLRFYSQRQLPLQWTRRPLRTGQCLPFRHTEHQQHGEHSLSWSLWNGLQVLDNPLTKMPRCENVLKCCVTLKSADAPSLSRGLWCGLGLGFCSHHSLVTQLCAGMCCWSGGQQWRLNIKPQLYLPLQGFKGVETLIMVFGLIL